MRAAGGVPLKRGSGILAVVKKQRSSVKVVKESASTAV
jgi:hypothetical protein